MPKQPHFCRKKTNRLFAASCSSPLTRQEQQDIALGFFHLVDLDGCADGRLQIVALRLRRVENLHWECATGNVHARAVVKILLKLAGIQCGAHNDDFQVVALGQDLLQQAHQNVGGQRAFVGFVQNNDAVALEQGISHGFAQQHTVGAVSVWRRREGVGKEQMSDRGGRQGETRNFNGRESGILEDSVGSTAFLETDGVADMLAQFHVHFVGHTLQGRERKEERRRKREERERERIFRHE